MSHGTKITKPRWKTYKQIFLALDQATFLRYDNESLSIKRKTDKTDKSDFSEAKTLYTSKDTIKKMKK